MSKKGKGKSVSLADFHGVKQGDRWADDEWDEGDIAEEIAQQDAALPPGERKGKVTHGRVIKDVGDTDWRTSEVQRPATFVPDDHPAPFIAFVGNLERSVDEDDLRGEFGLCGEIIKVDIVAKGDRIKMGYVTFATIEGLRAAMLLRGKIVKGRKLNVDLAEAKTQDSSHKGNRGGDDRKGGFGGVGLADAAWRDGPQQVQPQHGGFGDRDRRNRSRDDLFGSSSREDIEFSRDTFGAAEQPTTVDRPPRSPIREGIPTDFSRDSLFASQEQHPVRDAADLRGNRSSSKEDAADWRSGPGPDAAPVQPAPQPPREAADWRSGPNRSGSPVGEGEAGKKNFRSEGPRMPKRTESNDGGSWRDAMPAKKEEEPPAPAPKPAVVTKIAKRPENAGESEPMAWRRAEPSDAAQPKPAVPQRVEAHAPAAAPVVKKGPQVVVAKAAEAPAQPAKTAGPQRVEAHAPAAASVKKGPQVVIAKAPSPKPAVETTNNRFATLR